MELHVPFPENGVRISYGRLHWHQNLDLRAHCLTHKWHQENDAGHRWHIKHDMPSFWTVVLMGNDVLEGN